MMKHGGKVLLLFTAALVVAIGFSPQAWAQKATAKSFAQPDQTMEYHFMLSEGDLTEKNMTKFLAEKIIAPRTGFEDGAILQCLFQPVKAWLIASRLMYRI